MMGGNVRDIGLRMSNFSGIIDDGFAEALQSEPGKVCGKHTGWNFCGTVYFSDGKFHEEVWVYKVLRQTISAPTLPELMDAVCGVYGYD